MESMVQVRTVKPITYDGVRYSVGKVLLMSQADADKNVAANAVVIMGTANVVKDQ